MKKQLFDIPDFTGYKIDKNGNVYSMISNGCRNRFDKTKWLKRPKKINPRKTKRGYNRVYMRRDSTNKREDVYIHRIMAIIFIPNPHKLSDVNHKDSNPCNNKLENLEWMSHKENLKYGIIHGNITRNKLGQFTHK